MRPLPGYFQKFQCSSIVSEIAHNAGQSSVQAWLENALKFFYDVMHIHDFHIE
jgi:hypothetical protein